MLCVLPPTTPSLFTRSSLLLYAFQLLWQGTRFSLNLTSISRFCVRFFFSLHVQRKGSTYNYNDWATQWIQPPPLESYPHDDQSLAHGWSFSYARAPLALTSSKLRRDRYVKRAAAGREMARDEHRFFLNAVSDQVTVWANFFWQKRITPACSSQAGSGRSLSRQHRLGAYG